MMRSTILVAMLCCGALPALGAQADGSGQRESFRRAVVHNGKWLTAASVAALIMFAEREHTNSQREWNSLLDICRSAQDACALGADGRYIRSDAEQFYQRSRAFDRRANRWLLGAQTSLLATTALFIIDVHPGEGPDNIPFPSNRLEVGVRFPL